MQSLDFLFNLFVFFIRNVYHCTGEMYNTVME